MTSADQPQGERCAHRMLKSEYCAGCSVYDVANGPTPAPLPSPVVEDTEAVLIEALTLGLWDEGLIRPESVGQAAVEYVLRELREDGWASPAELAARDAQTAARALDEAADEARRHAGECPESPCTNPVGCRVENLVTAAWLTGRAEGVRRAAQ